MRRKDRLQLDELTALPRVGLDEASLQVLANKVEVILAGANVNIDLPNSPESFLAEPLTDAQLKLAAEKLGPEYATDGVAYQDLMLEVPIEESGEKMVSLGKLAADAELPLSFSKRPFPDACGEYAGKPRVYWARETVAKKFMHFIQLAQHVGLHVEVEDAFRPHGVQEGLFLRRVDMILAEHPDWIHDWDKVWTEARSKTAVFPILAGHKSGAAIDVTLYDAKTGEPLEIGNKYPAGGPKVAMHFPYLTQTEWEARQLFSALSQASGFVGYPFEDWHFSHGDVAAAARYDATHNTGSIEPSYVAKYGPVRDFDPATGKITATYKQEDLAQPFYDRATLLRLLGRE